MFKKKKILQNVWQFLKNRKLTLPCSFPIKWTNSPKVPTVHSPPALLSCGRGCFGDVNRLLQGAFKVDGPLLYDFPDVLDPVLLVFYAGSLNDVWEPIRTQKGPFLDPALTTGRSPTFPRGSHFKTNFPAEKQPHPTFDVPPNQCFVLNTFSSKPFLFYSIYMFSDLWIF